jgi:membrane dipeptidase
MRFFDAHCDTVMRVFDSNLDFVAGGSQSHIDLPRLLAAGSCVQLFAVFAVERETPGGDLRAYADRALATIWQWSRDSGGRMGIALTARDVRGACDTGRFHGLLGLEGADCLADKADNLQHFFELGVRHVIPAWADNAFSGTAFGSRGPLTSEGERLIALAEQLHVMIDVSHLYDAAFWRICQIARRPFIASHSDCRALCPHPRDLSDDMIRALAERGGVAGINLSPDFLDPEYSHQAELRAGPLSQRTGSADTAEERAAIREGVRRTMAGVPLPGPEAIVRHVQHMIQVGGEDVVGLGGDLDGIVQTPAGISGIESYPALALAMADAGLTPRQVDKVCWQNMARVFTAVLPQE